MMTIRPSTPVLQWFAAASAVFCVAAAENVDARMYQWSNQATGTVQLSGSPPAWYRSKTSGPRVFVFDNGQLVDDTAIVVPEEQRLVLRADAFGESATEQTDADEDDIARDELREALEAAARDGVDVTAVTEAFSEEREADDDRGEVEKTVNELKALLEQFDTQRINEAKALLESTAEP